MRVKDLLERIELEVFAGETGLEREVESGYCGDLLSDVMAHSPKGAVWFTVQSHQNIVAVALLKEMAAIILVNGRRPDEDTMAKADQEGIPVMVTSLGAYEAAGVLWTAGAGGRDR
ncbi:MAG: DRTGG domain-containing protein [Desulfatiglandales bacterium]